ncbi:hypothetical protein EKK58_10710 [Candidatus Dependentiae bacterium]|nr:MAG: hypothetical protein EKK58_10710 [Candidatus Dependentiae bacterium]
MRYKKCINVFLKIIFKALLIVINALAFRGTQSFADICNSCNIYKIKTEEHMTVHRGYQDIVDNTFENLNEVISKLIADNIIDPKKLNQIIITGHSLGGSIALLMAIKIKQIFQK